MRKAKKGQKEIQEIEINKTTKSLFNQCASELEPKADSLASQVKDKLLSSNAAFNGPKEARKVLNDVLINAIFSNTNWENLTPEKKNDIREIGMLQSSYDLRHFGGTEAITEVQLKSIESLEGTEAIPCVVVTVDREKFEQLNAIRVNKGGMEIGVGEDNGTINFFVEYADIKRLEWWRVALENLPISYLETPLDDIAKQAHIKPDFFS